MLDKLKFYFWHSLNDLRVNGQRTLFALLCIAAGVAAIVSLQTLGVMIDDTLSGSLRETNRGDIQLFAFHTEFDDEDTVVADDSGIKAGLVTKTDAGNYVFTANGIATFEQWFKDNYAGETRFTSLQIMNDPTAG